MYEQNISEYGFWKASSSRHKNGILYAYADSENKETFWSSDSQEENFITIEFPSKVLLKRFSIFLNYEYDESYTPQILLFQVGTNTHDLQDLFQFDLEEHPMMEEEFEGPNGWFDILFPNEMHPIFFLRVIIKKNFLDGRDTRIRGIKLFCE